MTRGAATTASSPKKQNPVDKPKKKIVKSTPKNGRRTTAKGRAKELSKKVSKKLSKKLTKKHTYTLVNQATKEIRKVNKQAVKVRNTDATGAAKKFLTHLANRNGPGKRDYSTITFTFKKDYKDKTTFYTYSGAVFKYAEEDIPEKAGNSFDTYSKVEMVDMETVNRDNK